MKNSEFEPYRYFQLLSTIEEKEEEYARRGLSISKLDEVEQRLGKREADDVRRLASELTEMLGFEEGSFFAVGGESFLIKCVSKAIPNCFIALKVAQSCFNPRPEGGWAGFVFRTKPNRQKIRFVEGLQIQAIVSQRLNQETDLVGGVPAVLKLSTNVPIFAALEWVDGYRFDRFCALTSEKARIVVFWRFLKLLEKIHSLRIDIRQQGGKPEDAWPVVHRDVKPHNIIVNQSYYPWLTDFSIAKPMMRENLTVAGEILGNRLYSAPEQLEGQSNEVDWRSDQYAAALMIPLVITRQIPPHRYRTRDAWIEEQKNYILRPLWEVFKKAASWDPDRRFNTTSEFVRAFENACQAYKIDFRRRQTLDAKKTQRINCASIKRCPHLTEIKREIEQELILPVYEKLEKLGRILKGDKEDDEEKQSNDG